MKKQTNNPIVVKAQKIVPATFAQKSKRWIKAHAQTIYLTSAGIAALSALYWMYLQRKYGIKKIHTEQNEAMQRTQDKLGDVTTKMAMTEMKITQKAKQIAGTQNYLKTQGESLDKRMSSVEKALHNKDFHEYMREKHNIVNMKRV